MKSIYMTPAAELLLLSAEDILTLSVGDGTVNFGDDDIKIDF